MDYCQALAEPSHRLLENIGSTVLVWTPLEPFYAVEILHGVLADVRDPPGPRIYHS